MEATETQPDQQQRIAILAFAGVMAALIVIYLIRNFDGYEEMNL